MSFDSPPSVGLRPAAWAVAASLGVHALGFAAFETLAPPQVSEFQQVWLQSDDITDRLNAEQLRPSAPAPLARKPNSLKQTPTAKPVPAAQPEANIGANKAIEPSPVAATEPPQSAAALAQFPTSLPAALPAVLPALLHAELAVPVPASPPIAEPLIANLPIKAAELLSPTVPAAAAPVAIEPATPVLNTQNLAPKPLALPASDVSPLPSYRLPNQLSVQFETTVHGFAGKSVLTWKKSSIESGARYEAQLSSTATVFFKTFEHRFKSSGEMNAYGLAPLLIEEKRPTGGTVATTIEPANQRVIISSQAGFLPYDPRALDVLGLMVQLAIYAQTQPQWLQAGTAQDFSIYRPSGIKRWRFQSMGSAVIEQGGAPLSTLYVRRVPAGTAPDFEDQYHFWLDLNRYGFPVKIRQVDSKGNATDINMVSWQAD